MIKATKPMNEREEEIWSEYFRIKNRLMDYDENLRDAISNARLLLRLKTGSGRVNDHYGKAQKHIGLILDLGLSSGAIPADANPNEIAEVEAVAQGKWKSIEDFERVQKYFRNWYTKTRFYNVTREKPRMLAPSEL